MTATPHSVSLLMYHLTMFDQALRAALWSPWQQELLKNCKNWLRWWINIFHVNKHSPAIPCLISLFFFSTPDLKLKTNEFVYDGMLCFPLNPYHWHVVLFTVLPTPPRFGFCMHNFWISPMPLAPRPIMCHSGEKMNLSATRKSCWFLTPWPLSNIICYKNICYMITKRDINLLSTLSHAEIFMISFKIPYQKC